MVELNLEVEANLLPSIRDCSNFTMHGLGNPSCLLHQRQLNFPMFTYSSPVKPSLAALALHTSPICENYSRLLDLDNVSASRHSCTVKETRSLKLSLDGLGLSKNAIFAPDFLSREAVLLLWWNLDDLVCSHWIFTSYHMNRWTVYPLDNAAMGQDLSFPVAVVVREWMNFS